MIDVAICSSGTATLENALLGVPMVVVYRMSWITYGIARLMVTVKHISMANLLAGTTVVTELIQHHASPRRIADEAAALLDDPGRWSQVRSQLLAVRRGLGEPGATERAAAAILSGTSG
jgi:lipid-A-disaccharide synthase